MIGHQNITDKYTSHTEKRITVNIYDPDVELTLPK